MDVTSYLLGKKSGGGGEVNLQNNKSVPITTNTTTEISPDENYDAMKKVTVTTNVQPNLESKSITIESNTTTTVTPTDGKDGLSSVEIITNVAGNINLDTDTKFAYSYWSTMPDWIVNANGWENRTNFYQTFAYCNNLTVFPSDLASKISPTNCNTMFYSCQSLQTVNLFDTSGINTTNGFTSMFGNCRSLSNSSINKILKMCANATSYTGTKTLTTLGISGSYYSSSTIQGLSNYQEFTEAGWTLGF